MRLIYSCTTTDKTFRDGRTMLLVQFLDANTNSQIGEWCPKWDEIRELTVKSIVVEERNQGGGRWLEMLRSVESEFLKQMPQKSIARRTGVIGSYSPPTSQGESEIAGEYTDTGDRPGWRPGFKLRLRVPCTQDIMDYVVAESLDVTMIIREEDVVDLRLSVTPGGFGNAGEEVSVNSIDADHFIRKDGHYVTIVRRS